MFNNIRPPSSLFQIENIHGVIEGRFLKKYGNITTLLKQFSATFLKFITGKYHGHKRNASISLLLGASHTAQGDMAVS